MNEEIEMEEGQNPSQDASGSKSYEEGIEEIVNSYVEDSEPEQESEQEQEQEQESEPVDEEEEEDSEEESESDLKMTLADLRNQITEMQKLLSQNAENAEADKGTDVEFNDFLTAEDAQKVAEKPELLNVVLKHVAKQTAIKTEKRLLGKIPAIVNSLVTTQVSAHKAYDSFVAKNPDVAKYPELLAQEVTRVYKKNPSMNLPKLYRAAGNRVRKVLKLKKVEKSKNSIVPPRSSRVQKRRVSGLHDRKNSERSLMEDLLKYESD